MASSSIASEEDVKEWDASSSAASKEDASYSVVLDEDASSFVASEEEAPHSFTSSSDLSSSDSSSYVATSLVGLRRIRVRPPQAQEENAVHPRA